MSGFADSWIRRARARHRRRFEELARTVDPRVLVLVSPRHAMTAKMQVLAARMYAASAPPPRLTVDDVVSVPGTLRYVFE